MVFFRQSSETVLNAETPDPLIGRDLGFKFRSFDYTTHDSVSSQASGAKARNLRRSLQAELQGAFR